MSPTDSPRTSQFSKKEREARGGGKKKEEKLLVLSLPEKGRGRQRKKRQHVSK